MVELAVPRALGERIAAIRTQHDVVDAAMLAEVVSAVVAAISADVSASQADLLREVESLGRTIAEARAEIAALGVNEISGRHIPSATDELDAVVSHTATATDTILEACETLDIVAAKLDGDVAAHLQTATTAIYEACSFQDITGQRIKKVVTALKAIDAKVATIVAASHKPVELSPEPVSLLNGPQLPAAAMDQNDIDQLMSSF